MVVVLDKPKLDSLDTEAQFSTLLMKRQYKNVEKLNNALAQLMMRLEKDGRNIVDDTSNIGGFHSDTQLMSRPEPEIATLREMVGEAVRDFTAKYVSDNCSEPLVDLRIRMWGWGINMREGDLNMQHVHPDAKVSGVYYVRIPKGQGGGSQAKPGGAIMFCDPRPRAHMNQIANQITEIVIQPEEGMMILFPSYYEHAVIPFRGGGVRTCIAFNADF